MRNRLAVFGVLLVALAAASAGLLAKGESSPEVGTWNVKVVPDAEGATKGEKEFDDTLTLKKGKFKSSACEPYGFGSTPYTVEGSSWMTDQESKNEGKSHWHGEVSGDAMSGKMTWTKPDGTVLNYAFQGTRAAAQTQTRKS